MQIVITLVVIFSCLKIILSLIRINPFKSIKNITIVDKYRLNYAKFIASVGLKMKIYIINNEIG